jgi:hypothetical protein
MSISLIANSGIQLHKIDLELNPNENLIKSVGFCETIDDFAIHTKKISLEYAYYLSDFDCWVKKKELVDLNYLTEENKLVENISEKLINFAKINEDSENETRYSISDINTCINYFLSTENNNFWLPIPYFKSKNSKELTFGPSAWARMLIYRNQKNGYKITLAFDTQLSSDNNVYYAPNDDDTNLNENSFSLVQNEDYLLSFFTAENSTDWVNNYLRKELVDRGIIKEESESLKYIAYYIYLLKYLKATQKFPDIELVSDKTVAIDVDLVLDVGNSSSFGLLFESKNGIFDFNAVKKLKLHDLTKLGTEYSGPISMMLAFVEPNFGNIYIPGFKNFRWPSIVRLGEEANNSIKSSNINFNKNSEFVNHHSSPKRYLWDNVKSDIPWEFLNFKGTQNETVYYEGLSEQFKENGDFAADGKFDCNPAYSKKSLMTLVFNELFLHAFMQINSYEYRMVHGNPDKPRKLRRVTITCPTSIIQEEQVVLRKCAQEALRILKRFFNKTYLEPYDLNQKEDFEIIPNPKDLSLKLNELEFKKDWIYDEATCCQLVFLYAELSKRYLNNADVFFNLYGKKRTDSLKPEQNSLTIASLDIGGGTTDLIICNYEYEKGQGRSVINPTPLYWESFNLAGDDLLKEIVQQVIIEGLPSEEFRGKFGIKCAAEKKGVSNIAGKMNSFFGSVNNNQTFEHRIFKKNFIAQIAIPIAIKYLEHTLENSKDQEVGYDYFFPKNDANKQLIEYFNNHFSPLKFEEIKWWISSDPINSLTEIVFEPLLKQLAVLMSSFGSDFVLLAGRPSTLPMLSKMFIKYYPVSPDRIISLNNYRVGRWYPFADDIGYFKDPKTIVSVGAIIALMSGKLDMLEGFRINTEKLKQKLIATSDYIGVMNSETQQIVDVCFSPDSNYYELEIHTLPIIIGYKQLKNKSYRARPLYKIKFNKDYFVKQVKRQYPQYTEEKEIMLAAESAINSIKLRMPVKLMITREWNVSRELIIVDSAQDKENNEISKQMFTIGLQTLPNENGYWLDTGEFTLNIK